jgi:hypothetical protein
MGHNEEAKTVQALAEEYAKNIFVTRKLNNNLMHTLKSAENDWLMGYLSRDQEVLKLKAVIELLEPLVRKLKENDDTDYTKEAIEAVRMLTLMRMVK